MKGLTLLEIPHFYSSCQSAMNFNRRIVGWMSPAGHRWETKQIHKLQTSLDYTQPEIRKTL